MPKSKTNRSAAKRFKRTGGSTVRRGKAYRRHCLSCKSRKQKRHLRGPGAVDATNMKAVDLLLPNSN